MPELCTAISAYIACLMFEVKVDFSEHHPYISDIIKTVQYHDASMQSYALLPACRYWP